MSRRRTLLAFSNTLLPSSSLPFRRMVPHTPEYLPCPGHRTISSACLSSRTFTTPLATTPLGPRTTRDSPARPFFTSARRAVGFGGPTYRRFGQGPQPRRVIPVKTLIATIAGSGFLYVYNLETVEQTGRRRFNVVSHTNELEMGKQQYGQVLAQNRALILPDNHPLARSVNRVLQRLIPEAPIEGADWRVHVINDDKMANAFVLPGGKVFVFTGILGVCGDEDGLATVLAHEISHVVAHHHGERLSNSLIVSALVLLTSAMFDISNTASIILRLGFSLPNSRIQEAEADSMGLIMMANACFPPEAAVKLWSRMEKIEKVKIPQFVSTHPSSYNRMGALREQLQKAEDIYEAKGCKYIKDQIPGFRQASDTPIMRDPYLW